MSKAVADNRDTLHLVKVNYYKQQTEMLRKKRDLFIAQTNVSERWKLSEFGLNFEKY